MKNTRREIDFMSNQTGQQKKGRFHLEHWQIISAFLILYDILAVVFSYLFALWIRFDCE